MTAVMPYINEPFAKSILFTSKLVVYCFKMWSQPKNREAACRVRMRTFVLCARLTRF